MLDRQDHQDDDIICKCHDVTRGTLAGLAGRLDVDEVCAKSGAGRSCGGCHPLIKEIAGFQTMFDARLVTRTVLDDRHAAYVFRAAMLADRARIAAVRTCPCRDILLERRLEHRSLHRSYTCTKITAEGDIEIIVRREVNGMMSRWLSDEACPGAEKLRISLPFGGINAVCPESRSVHFWAGGIGITPALSWLTHLAVASETEGKLPPKTAVHWWGRFQFGSALIARLEAAASLARTRGLTVSLVLHDTNAAARRPTSEHWVKQLATDANPETDRIHVCGPVGFMDGAARAFDAVAWPDHRRVLESFVASPGAGAAGRPRTLHKICTFNPTSDPIICNSFKLAAAESCETKVLEAEAFLRQFYYEIGGETPFSERLDAVRSDILGTGTYRQTYDELAFGARLAWRNSARCIGRFFWQSLTVRDLRHLDHQDDSELAAGVFDEIRRHLRESTNEGNIRPMITVFRPEHPALKSIRILNPQIILYAAHRQSDGSVVGDPKSLALTDLAKAYGWEGKNTRFDVLPLMIRIGDGAPQLFEFLPEEILEVQMTHPEAPGVADLGLRWFAVPAVSDLALDMGGLVYPAAPSNGFYMSTEIGSFNLSDPRRYNVMPDIARALELDISEENPLWRDRAIVEINRMVLHSFRRAGVRIMDHHALAEWFDRFRADEGASGRPVYGHWPWIVPPMSANLFNVWHDSSLRKVVLKPNYFYPPRSEEMSESTARAQEAAIQQVFPGGRAPTVEHGRHLSLGLWFKRVLGSLSA